MMRNPGNDRGAARLATVTWLVVVLAIIGVLGFDGFSVLSDRVKAQNDAQTAAYAASQAWHTTQNLDDAYQAAVTSVAGTGDVVLTRHFTIDSDGTAHLLLRRRANTIVLKHISAFRKYTVALEHGDANSIN
jgi:hypothetical protein